MCQEGRVLHCQGSRWTASVDRRQLRLLLLPLLLLPQQQRGLEGRSWSSEGPCLPPLLLQLRLLQQQLLVVEAVAWLTCSVVQKGGQRPP